MVTLWRNPSGISSESGHVRRAKTVRNTDYSSTSFLAGPRRHKSDTYDRIPNGNSGRSGAVAVLQKWLPWRLEVNIPDIPEIYVSQPVKVISGDRNDLRISGVSGAY